MGEENKAEMETKRWNKDGAGISWDILSFLLKQQKQKGKIRK